MKNSVKWEHTLKDISEKDLMRTVINNDSHLLKEVSKELIDRLRHRNVADDVIFDVHVAFEESLRNAMIHGNNSDPEKKVTIETELHNDILTIIVEDEGEGFEPRDLPDPTLDENLLKESGRGVYLIEHLMDEVKYENRGRRVVMKKHLRPETHRRENES